MAYNQYLQNRALQQSLGDTLSSYSSEIDDSVLQDTANEIEVRDANENETTELQDENKNAGLESLAMSLPFVQSGLKSFGSLYGKITGLADKAKPLVDQGQELLQKGQDVIQKGQDILSDTMGKVQNIVSSAQQDVQNISKLASDPNSFLNSERIAGRPETMFDNPFYSGEVPAPELTETFSSLNAKVLPSTDNVATSFSDRINDLPRMGEPAYNAGQQAEAVNVLPTEARVAPPTTEVSAVPVDTATLAPPVGSADTLASTAGDVAEGIASKVAPEAIEAGLGIMDFVPGLDTLGLVASLGVGLYDLFHHTAEPPMPPPPPPVSQEVNIAPSVQVGV